MLIVVIDGQGGGIGRQIVEKLRPFVNRDRHTLCAVGTNAAATAAMLKAGADSGATGENAVRVMAARADVVVGPIGILLAEAMMGELTADMAAAIAACRAKKVVVPVGRCGVTVACADAVPLGDAVDAAVRIVSDMLA